MVTGVGVWLWERYFPKQDQPSDSFWKGLPLGVRVGLFGAIVGAVGAFNWVALPFVMVGRKRLGGIPYFPSSPRQVDRTLRLLPLRRLQGQLAVDLGAGDGRVVVEAAQRGLRARGYEYNPWLLRRAQRRAEAAGVTDAVEWHAGDMWKAPLEGVSVVTLYGVTEAMDRFEGKLRHELSPGAYVVSVLFPLPLWEPLREDHQIFLYRVPDSLPEHLRAEFELRTADIPPVSPPYDPNDTESRDEEEEEQE